MAAYDTPGAFTGGVWLVTGNGKAFFASRDKLPPTGTGYKYWWIGADENSFNNRVLDAFSHLNVTPPTNYNLDANTNSQLHHLIHQGGTVDIGLGNFFTSGAQNAAAFPAPGGKIAGAATKVVGAAGAAAAGAATSGAGIAGIAALLTALFSPHLFYILGGFVLLLFAVLIIIKQPIKSR